MPEDSIRLNLKAIRNKAGLSLAATSEITGVSKAMLGQIERGESSPTLQTVWKLAKGFRIPLSALIDMPPATDRPPTDTTRGMVGEMQFKTLFPYDAACGYETFLIDLHPGQVWRSAPHDTGVSEDIIVVTGMVEVLLGDKWTTLETGQALRFVANQTHGYRNPLETRAEFINTIHYSRTGIPG
jgi:transcriptional regulator with XRE-family HTH domain